ncbi:hypothetical protein NLJ89_g7481 [Agrocybe chaxingu]|uniref:DNA 3'-5' helicase n=1 Tax=Agrocybe chaxingu TaxID=84603 RepID=A0A9W8K3J3_9AGAR|nr:hypothetical protein NLJ89_g7481 [Agrocybe chaxingu]
MNTHCTVCNVAFLSNTELKAHCQQHHRTAVFTIGNDKFSVAANADGSFECPCGSHLTPTSFSNINEFAVHLKRVLELHETRLPEKSILLTHQLIDTQTLRAYSLVVNTMHRLLVCSTCCAGVLPSHVAGHLRDTHQLVAPVADLEIIQSISQKLNVTDAPPPHPSAPIPPIDGLRVVVGFLCSQCSAVYGVETSLKTHFHNTHPGLTFPKKNTRAPVQQINAGRHHKYFVVSIPNELRGAPSTPQDFILAQAQALMQLSHRDDKEPDVRNISPWLRATQWHKLLVGRNVQDLVKLAETPTRAEFPDLHDTVRHLLDQASALIETSAPLLLQILNSPLGPNDITNRPFKKHLDRNTLPTYSTSLTGFIAMLLRGPLFTLPGDVQSRLDSFKVCLSKGTLDDSAEALQTLLISLWQRAWPASAADQISDPTLLYLALVSLKPSGQFIEPKIVTNIIARFEYIMRLTFLYAIHHDSDAQTGLAASRPWFIEKVESTFNSLRTLQHFASSIAYQTINLPRIWWTDTEAYRTMLYHGYPVTLANITSMLSALEVQMKDVYEVQLLYSLDVSVSYTTLFDDLANKEAGYSFTTDPKNPIFSDNQLLLRAILNDPRMRARILTVTEQGGLCWNIHELRRWLLSYAVFSLLLLVRCNLTGGAPGRITELTAAQLINTASYPLRNLVVFHKHLALLCTYLKTSALIGHDRLIPHSLDAFTSDLLIQDLAVVRPFARFAARVCHSNRPDIINRFDTHLFVNHTQLFTTDDVTEALKELALPHLEFPLNSGHTKQTENRIYGLSHDNLGGAAEDVLPLFLDASTDWQMSLAVVPGGTGLPYREATQPHFHDLLNSGTISLPPSDPKASIEDRLQHLEILFLKRLDDLEHRLMSRFNSLGYRTPDFVVSPPSSMSSLESVDELPSTELENSALATLRRVLQNPAAMWTCPEQKLAVLAALKLKCDLVVVMATSSGKSMVPIIPSLVEKNRTTVLVLPFRALVLDFVSKLTRMSIPFDLYSPAKRLSPTTNLVIVSADLAMTAHWRESIVLLNAVRPVVRYVLDEAHVPPTSCNYRQVLQYMSDLRCNFPVQVVLLSGTMNKHLVDVSKKHFCLSPNTLVLRMSTNRPELRYVWNQTDAPSILDRISSLVKRHLASPQDRALVFVPFLNVGVTLAQALNAPFYHGQLDESAQQSAYRAWVDGKSPVMVATSAFGTGNDYPHVRLIVHAGTPFDAISFIQEVSRAGRDRASATCILLHTKPNIPRPDLSPEEDLSGRIAMHEAIMSSMCIRFLLTSYIDGHGTRCTDTPGQELCSRCSTQTTQAGSSQPTGVHHHPSPFLESTRVAKRVRVGREQEENEYVRNFKHQLSRFSNACAICYVFAVNHTIHGLKECPTLVRQLGPNALGQFFDWSRSIRYSSQKVCYFCHIPQGPNDQLHSTFQRSRSACAHPDVVAPAVFAVLLHPNLCYAASDKFKTSFDRPSTAIPFINGPTATSHETNLSALFLWYCSTL